MFDKSKRPKVAWTEATPYLIYCAVAFAFGNLLFGIDTGSFGSIQALPSFLNSYAPLGADGKHAFSTVDKSTMNSVVWPGKIFGTFMFEPLAERLGYKRTMYIVSFVQCVALVVQMTAKDWKVFTGGRVIAYAAVGVVENAAPSYISEVAPAGMRGFFGGAMVVVVTIGNLWGALMGRAYANETRKLGYLVCVGVQFIPALLILVLVPFCVESPRWLLSKGRHEDASRSLDRLRPHADVAAGRTLGEIEALQEAVETQDVMDHGRWIDLFRTKGGHLRRTLVACGIFFFQQTAGNQLVNSYGPTFFKIYGLGDMAFTYNTMITAIGILGAITGVMLCDIVGRRPLLLVGLALSAVFSAVVGGLGTKPKLGSSDIHMIVASFVFVVVGNKMGVNVLCYLIASELGGTHLRKKTMALSTSFDVVSAFAITFTIPYLLGKPGANLAAKVGFVFMGICVAGFLFCFFFVPELSGRSLEEVDELFEQNLWAWQFKGATTTGVGARIAALERGGGAPVTDSKLDEELAAEKPQVTQRETV